MECVNSTTYIKRPPAMTNKAEKFLYTKELLTNRIFSGFYRERKYVPKLNEYRDVIVIAPEETDLLQDVNRLRKKWEGVSDIRWVGITGSEGMNIPKGCCFWVKLSNLAFGHYWFFVKHVKLKDDEVILHLKCLRKVQKSEIQFGQAESYVMRNEVPESSVATTSGSKLNLNLDPEKVASSIMTTCDNMYQSIYPHVTWKNLFHAIRTACAFVVFISVGSVCMIGNLGEFILKLLREFTLFIHAFSPIVVQIIDFLSKVVGGFYILLAGMFANNRNRQPQIFNTRLSIQNTPTNWKERNQKLRKELLSGALNR